MKIYSADLISGSLSGSFTGLITSASHALTASYIEGGGGGGDAFPYTGSAGIQGTLDVTGDITSATGDIISSTGAVTSNGNITSATGDIVSSTGAVTADGNITSNNGNIVSSNGDIISSNGAVTANGDITSTQGNLTVSAGTITADGSITATTGDIISTTGAVTAEGNITSNTGNIISSTGAVTADGNITSNTGNIEASSGNFSAPAGGLTVDLNINSSNGGLTVDQDIQTNSGNLAATNGGLAVDADIISNNGNITTSGGNIETSTGNFNAPNGALYVDQNIETSLGDLIANGGGLTVETDITSNTGGLTVDGNITSNNGIFTGDGSGLTNLPGGGGGGAAISSSAFDFQFVTLERDMNSPTKYEDGSTGGFTWYSQNSSIMPTGTVFSGNEGYDPNAGPIDRFSILKYRSEYYNQNSDIFYNFLKKIGIEEDQFQYSDGIIYLPEAILIELETPQGTSYSSKVRFLCTSIGYKNRSNVGMNVEYWFGGSSDQTYNLGGGMISSLNMLDKNDFILSESSGTYYDTTTVSPSGYEAALRFKVALNPATATIGTEVKAAGINVTNNMNISFAGFASSPFSDFAIVEGFQDSGFAEYPFLGEFRDRLYNGAVFDRIEFIDDNGNHEIFEDEWVVAMGENPNNNMSNSQEIKLISKTLKNNLTSTTGTSYNILNSVQQSSLFIIGQLDQIVPREKNINGTTVYGGDNNYPFPITKNQTSLSKIKLTGDIEGQGDAHFTGDFKANSLEGGAINSKDVGTIYNKFTTEDAVSNPQFERLESNNSFMNNKPYIGWFDSMQSNVSYYNLYQNAGYDSNNMQGYSDFAYFEMAGFRGVGMVDETISSFLKNFGIDTSTLTNSHHLFTFTTPIWITIQNSQANGQDSFKVKVAVSTILLQEITSGPYNTKIYFGGEMKGDQNGGINIYDAMSGSDSYLPRFRHSDFDIEGKNVYGQWKDQEILRLTVHNGPTTRIGATHLHSKGDGKSSGEVIYKDYSLPNTVINSFVNVSSTTQYGNDPRPRLELQNLNNYTDPNGNQPAFRSGDWFDLIEFSTRNTNSQQQEFIYSIRDIMWFVEMDPINNSNMATLIAVDNTDSAVGIHQNGNYTPFSMLSGGGGLGMLGDITSIRLSRGSEYGGTGQLEVSGDSILQSNLYLPNLPTSDPGVAGMIYTSGAGNLKISFG
jgi:hypothetical protein